MDKQKQRTKMKCLKHNCPKLHIEVDGAGGETYKCNVTENASIILGEIAHWADKSDYPKPISNCQVLLNIEKDKEAI